MKIENVDDGKKGRFYILHDGKKAAEMTYVYAGPQLMIIDHTEVSIELKGLGAGKKMVEQAVLFAREKGLKILPLCPFAKSVFDKTPEFIDVL